MTYDVIRSRPEIDRALLNDMAVLTSATVHEVMMRRGALDSRIKPIRKGMRICGRAFTVWAEPGDNLIVHKALSMAGEGDILTVCCRTPEEGFWGEVMSVAAMARGINGLLTDGGVRDTDAIEKAGFPIFSANICIKGTLKHMPGKINHPMVMGGQLIRPGDIVIGDDDGVVIVPVEMAGEVFKGALAREEKEQGIMRRLRAGETTMDVLGLNAAYDALRLTEEA